MAILVQPHTSPVPPLPTFTFSPFFLQVVFSKACKQVHSFKDILALQNKLSPYLKLETCLVFCVLGMKGTVTQAGVCVLDCCIPVKNQLEQEWLQTMFSWGGEEESFQSHTVGGTAVDTVMK